MLQQLLVGLLVALLSGALAQDRGLRSACEDVLSTTAVVAPKLNAPFFSSSKSSYPWWIIENSGHFEDTLDGLIEADDLRRTEHSANCISTHQGEHTMSFCEAVATPNGVVLDFSGGMPAYASTLQVTIDSKLGYKCSFHATYPAPTGALKWKIKKKELRLKSRKLRTGSRIFGWISVTFEELDESKNASNTYTIEGYFKPVLQHAKP